MTLSKLPAVNQTAVVRVRLRSQVKVGRARLTVRVPDTLELVTKGSPLSAPQHVGVWQQSEGVMAIDTRTRDITLHVRAKAAGPAQIEAGLTDTDAPSPEREAHGSVLLTVGTKSSAGRGASRSGVNITSLSGRSGARLTKSAKASEKFAQTPRTDQPTAGVSSVASATQICATGGFQFANKAGAWLGGRSLMVNVWGRTTAAAAAQVYASGSTDRTGVYNLCFTSPVASMYQLYVEFRSENSVWKVVDKNNSAYSTTTVATYNVSTDHDFGWTSPSAAQMRAWHAFDTLNLTWWWRSSGTGCWTARENANCSKMTVQWWPGNADGGYYTPGANAAASYLRLRDDDPDSEHIVVHESAHALMHMLYNWWWPNVNCAGHQIQAVSSVGCGWTEGFANAVAGSVKGDNKFVWPNGASIDLMNSTRFDPSQPVSGKNWQDGDAVEGRVAGSLIDLWNQVDHGQAGTINLMRTYTASSFGEYFKNDRPAVGLSTSDTARNLLYGHTVDYR